MTAGSLTKAETQLPRGLGSKNRLDAINRQRQSDVTSGAVLSERYARYVTQYFLPVSGFRTGSGPFSISRYVVTQTVLIARHGRAAASKPSSGTNQEPLDRLYYHQRQSSKIAVGGIHTKQNYTYIKKSPRTTQ